MLNKREIEILEFLITNNKIEISILSEKYSVTVRTLRYNIKNINNILFILKINKIKIIKNIIYLFLGKDDEDELLKYIETLKYSTFSKNERKEIYTFLILIENKINIKLLTEILFVSRTTIKKDLKEMERNKKIYSNNNFYYLNIKDYEKFDVKLKLLNKIIFSKKLNENVYKIIPKLFMDNVEIFLNEIDSKVKLNLNSENYKNIFSYILILVYYNEVEIFNSSFKDDNLEFIENKFIKIFNTNKNMNKIIDAILGLSLNCSFNNWINETIFIKKFIFNMSEDIKIDLTKDMILYDFLCFHMKSCIYRLKKNLFIEEFNFLNFDDDKLFNFVKKNLEEIEKAYNIVFNNNEVYLISYHFIAAIQRNKNNDNKNVLLVCGLGYGTTMILKENLETLFDINIVDIFSIQKYIKEKSNLKNIDLVLSTVDLDDSVIKINPILSENEKNFLIQKGLKIKRNKLDIGTIINEIEKYSEINKKEELINNLMKKYGNYFNLNSEYNDESIIDYMNFNNVEFLDNSNKKYSLEDLIRKSVKILKNNGSVEDLYADEILKMLKTFGTYIFLDYGIVIPHSNKKYAKKNDVSFLIMKEPEFFEDKKAKIFICFSTIDNSYNKKIINLILSLMKDKRLLEDILNLDNYFKLEKLKLNRGGVYENR